MPSIKNILLSLALAAVVASQSQISDGQIQVATTTAAPVSQITDGQIQAPTKVTTTVAPISQITDGQPQAPKVTTTVAPVSQITDGQIQAPTKPASISVLPSPSANGTFTTGTAPVATFKGAANLLSWNKEIVGAAVGVAAVFAML